MSLFPELEPPKTFRQLATEVVNAYWDGVKAETGKPPLGVRHQALVGIVTPFMEHYEQIVVARALVVMRRDCRAFTRQVLEEYVDGRHARKQAAPKPSPIDRPRARRRGT